MDECLQYKLVFCLAVKKNRNFVKIKKIKEEFSSGYM